MHLSFEKLNDAPLTGVINSYQITSKKKLNKTMMLIPAISNSNNPATKCFIL